MALVASNVSALPNRWSNGPVRQQVVSFSVANGDTSGTITADGLTQVYFAVVTGVTHTAAPTYSGNVVTLAFADPTATRYGQAIVYGV